MNTRDNAPAAGQGEDDARPQDDAQQTPANQPPEPGSDLPTEDPEAAELAAALAAAEAEERGEQPSTAAAAQQEQQQEPVTQPPAATTAPPGTSPSGVPYERFQQVNRRARTLEEENAYLKGALAVLKEQGGSPAAPAPDQQGRQPAAPAANTPEQAIAAAEERAIEAARRFDTGEITAEELTRVQTQAAREIATAQVAAAMQATRPAASAPSSMTDEILLEQHVQQLEANVPVLKALNAQQMNFLRMTAEAEAAAAGQPYQATPRDTMRLREHVANLATAMAPYWGIQAPAAPPGQTAPQNGTQPPRQQGLSPSAQNRLRKMDMAAGLPPDIARMGQTAGSGDLTDQQLLAMSDDEIAALPPTVRARFQTM